MKAFFGNLNFPRVVILLSLIASGVLGWMVYERSARLAQVEADLTRVPQLVKDIQELGFKLTDLQELASGSEGGEDFDFDPFIRRTAADGFVGIGQVKIDPRTDDYTREVVDRIYKIRLASKNQRYNRGRIGNFLYKLEADNRRVKVTNLKLTPFESIKPGEIGADQWQFEASITSRTQKGT